MTTQRDTSPYVSPYIKIIRNGLGKANAKRKIVIVGAGMAGLTAAYELMRAGYKVVVLEAQLRVGGRIQTLREPFTHGLYAEAGAMRIPEHHQLAFGYLTHLLDEPLDSLREEFQNETA